MKRKIFAVLSLLLALSSTRLAHADATAKEVTSSIVSANTHRALIEHSLNIYKRTQIVWPNSSADDADMAKDFAYAYSKERVIYKIVAHYYGGDEELVASYYFWKGQLFLSTRTNLQHHKFDGKTTVQSHSFFYVTKARVVYCVEDGIQNAGLRSTREEYRIIYGARNLLTLAQTSDK